MQLKTVKLNNDRLSGNKLFLHKFNNFSTTSVRTSLKIHIIHALISILAILAVVYIIVVVLIVSNIINKKEGLATINDLNIQSARVERNYNLAIIPLTKDYALLNGFVDMDMSNFASRKDDAASLSFLYEGKGE